MTPCPTDETITAFQEGTLPPAEREALEAHAASCASCRRVLLVAGTARVEAKTLPRWAWAAAAAVLLVVAGVYLLQRDGPAPVAGPVAVAAFPEGPLGGRGILIPGLSLIPGAGARLEAHAATRSLRAEAGKLWLRVWDGDPVRVELPGTVLEVKRGEVAVILPLSSSRTALDLLAGQAWAGEEASAVWVLDGEASVAGRTLRSGSGWIQDAKGWHAATATAGELSVLRREGALAAAALGGRPVGASVPAVYRWVTVLKGRSPSTELGLTLGIPDGRGGAAWHRWVVGLAGGASAPVDVVEVAWDGSRLTGRVNGMEVFASGREGLARLLRPAEKAGWDVSVWGGKAEIASSGIQ